MKLVTMYIVIFIFLFFSLGSLFYLILFYIYFRPTYIQLRIPPQFFSLFILVKETNILSLFQGN